MPKERKNWIYIQTFDSTDSFKLHVENENVSLKCKSGSNVIITEELSSKPKNALSVRIRAPSKIILKENKV